MKLLGEVLSLAIKYLEDKGVSSPKITAGTLLAHVLGKSRIELYMQFELPLKEEELQLFRAFLKRAASFEPIEYILSGVDFYGCKIAVSRSVLIPRPETEILVDKGVEKIKKRDTKGLVLWDLCTGSGCIALSLKKKFPDLLVSALDKSAEALAVCSENAKNNGLEIEILQGDLLDPVRGRKADYVFCNPPYIREEEYATLDPSVRDYEPRMALIAGESGLEFYERLARELPNCLHPRGKVFLEIGTGQGNSLKSLFQAPCWKEKELLLDFAGHDRFFFLEIE